MAIRDFNPLRNFFWPYLEVLAFQLLSKLKQKNPVRENFLIFRKWNFLIPGLKNVLYFWKWNPAAFSSSSKSKNKSACENFLYFRNGTPPPKKKIHIVLKTETPNKFFLFHETEMKMFYISNFLYFLHFMKQLSQLKK